MNPELLKDRGTIEAWLREHQIRKIELVPSPEYGFIVNIKEHLYLSNNRLTNLSVKFGIIEGHFICDNNQLQSLYGAPDRVEGGFYCVGNQLTNLEYFPQLVQHHVVLNNNNLTSLQGCPSIVGENFWCHNNQLENIQSKDFPDIGGAIYLDNNPALGELQDIRNLQKLKEILQIKEENERLNNIIQSATIQHKAFKI